MPALNWQGLFTQWNQELLQVLSEDEEKRGWLQDSVPPDVLASGWLGYPGATEEQLVQLETLLGARLPPSYREFLAFSNGWREIDHFVSRLLSTDEVEWLAVRKQWVIDIWQDGEPDIQA